MSNIQLLITNKTILFKKMVEKSWGGCHNNTISLACESSLGGTVH